MILGSSKNYVGLLKSIKKEGIELYLSCYDSKNVANLVPIVEAQNIIKINTFWEKISKSY